MKPKVATPALILISAATLICAVTLLASIAASRPPEWLTVMSALALLLAVTVVGAIWLTRVHRLRTWIVGARERWKNFDEAKRVHGTTAELTILSVDALEPTGSWITIKWNRFDHIQAAWLEALHEPIWAGSVLLISPDPAQVMPRAPWPATYYISASDCLAWAPAASRPDIAILADWPRPEIRKMARAISQFAFPCSRPNKPLGSRRRFDHSPAMKHSTRKTGS